MKHLIAVIRSERLEPVEALFKEAGAPGISVSTVKGYGQYANFFTHDWMVRHVRLETFAEDQDAERLARLIVDGARTGLESDGIVVLEPVDRVVHVRSGMNSVGEENAASGSRPVPQRESRALPVGWSAVTVIGLLAIGVSAVVSARHQLHLLTLGLVTVLALSAVVGLLSVARNRGTNVRRRN